MSRKRLYGQDNRHDWVWKLFVDDVPGYAQGCYRAGMHRPVESVFYSADAGVHMGGQSLSATATSRQAR